MLLALEQADLAAQAGDVPVGAVLVDDGGRLVSSGQNRREREADPTAHAEMEALRAAARSLGRWRLGELTAYVTLEPCPMCAGALIHARVARVVYGCADEKAGALGSLFVLGSDPRLNHRFAVRGGVLAAACAERLRRFFQGRRGEAAGEI
ncbi:MAG: nucleoside deaminase [Deltaproteobacteria bacterium]|nr:nucleoside deaminase [Deltaproteobacteria bacterium]